MPLMPTVRQLPCALLLALGFSIPGLGDSAASPPCDGAWVTGLGSGNLKDDVRALALFDAGDGVRLYAGGSIVLASGLPASHVVVYVGDRWETVGGGVDGAVDAMSVFDDGSGPALYVGGAFTSAGGEAASNLARWNGSSWSAVGGGTSGRVRALEVHDDGTGSALYAAGHFTEAGGVAAGRIARWDGRSWSPLAAGVGGPVMSMESCDLGGGPTLFVGGEFLVADGESAPYLAEWRGEGGWIPTCICASGDATALGLNGPVLALRFRATSAGPELVVGGSFTSAGAVAASRIATWNGVEWNTLGAGFNNSVRALATLNDGSGDVLYAGGSFVLSGGVPVQIVGRWDSSAGLWQPLPDTVFPPPGVAVGALLVLSDWPPGAAFQSAQSMVVGGNFTSIGGHADQGVSRWDGATWWTLNSGASDTVHMVSSIDEGSGPVLWVGGKFTTVGQAEHPYLARWDGREWTSIGTPLTASIDAWVDDVAMFDDGAGPHYYICGRFLSSAGVELRSVAKLVGDAWHKVGASGLSLSSGQIGFGTSMTVFDDGTGPALYVCGTFESAGGVPVDSIARWSGRGWSAVGSFYGEPKALAVHDAGDGAKLYCAGQSGVSRWDGSAWINLDAPHQDTEGMVSFDAGDGPRLYVSYEGGVFGGVQRWDPASGWEVIGQTNNGGGVWWVDVVDLGDGPTLHAGGAFTSIGGRTAGGLARWSGGQWSAYSDTYKGPPREIAVLDEPDHRSLYMGGEFVTVDGVPSSYIARWQCAAPASCDADLDGDGSVDGLDLGLLLSAWGQPSAADFDGDGVVGNGDLVALLAVWGRCSSQR